MNEIEKYYNKFNEDKRLKSRHGQVEFFVTMTYLKKVIGNRKKLNILDIGAGTGAYSIPLFEIGHNVTAVELVKKNLSVLKMKNSNIKCICGDAKKLKLPDESFDLTLVFGPLYHLISHEEKIEAIKEATRVTKKNGHILLMYLMNDYAVITYAFKEGNLQKVLSENKLDENFQCLTNKSDLYSYVRIEEIEKLKNESGLKREKIIAVDGATDYIRPTLNKMTEEDFEIFKKYQLSICERKELLGASSHVLDILKKTK